MAAAPLLNSPGIRIEEIFLKPQLRLVTGVPGFVGPAKTAPQAGAADRPFPLRRKQELADYFDCPADGFLGDAVAAFFENGG